MYLTWILLFSPGFLIAAVIGLARSRGRPRWAKLLLISTGCGVAGAALLYGGLIALFFYGTRTSVVMHAQPPLTVAQARADDCPIPLPDAATHVQFAFASGGLVALEILVRFEAPVAVCRAHADTVFNYWDKEEHLPMHHVALVPIGEPPKAEDGDMVGRAAWFDAELINKGVTASDQKVTCWIDEDRGVFFCKITD